MKKFRIIVAGGRDYDNYEKLKNEMNYIIRAMIIDEIEIVSGGCNIGTHTFTRKDGTKVCGADGLGERFAEERDLPVVTFDADWNKYKKSAGVIRNTAMGKYSTHALLFWDGKSHGTKDMMDKAKRFGLIGGVVNYISIKE